MYRFIKFNRDINFIVDTMVEKDVKTIFILIVDFLKKQYIKEIYTKLIIITDLLVKRNFNIILLTGFPGNFLTLKHKITQLFVENSVESVKFL